MIIPFSQDARLPCKHDVFASVKVLSPEIGSDIQMSPDPLPAQANNVSLINCVFRSANIAQIAKAVVCGVVVDVVNNVGLLIVGKKPSNAMSKINFPAELDVMVSPSGACVSRWSMRLNRLAGATNPQKLAGSWAVSKVFADRVWNNLCSHLKSPLHLVRGLTVGAVSTPILPANTHKLNIEVRNG
jgi:hypothetical protein